jgi:hypothetical protein
MTVKHVEIYICDRCGTEYEKTVRGRVVVTAAIGWFKFRNGSGSKVSSPMGRPHENLDHDLCTSCTVTFFEWWKAGKEYGG